MKAIICAAGGDAVIYSPGKGRWEPCQCGASAARWEDPENGTVIVAVRPGGKDYVRGLGLNNRLLLPAIVSPGLMHEDFRRWHEQATDAPGFIFDASKAACWAVPFIIGTTSDVRWATDAEASEVLGTGGMPEPSGERERAVRQDGLGRAQEDTEGCGDDAECHGTD